MQKQNLGIVVDNLGASTRNYKIIELGNRIARDHIDIDFYVFNQEWKQPSHTISFPLLQHRNMWGFNGILISTDISTTRKLLNLPNTCHKYFYVWDMFEWATLNSANEAYDIYSNNELTLLARSEEYGKILAANFNTIPYLIEDFNYDSICKLCKIHKQSKA